MKIKEGEQLPNSEFYYLDSSGAAKKITTAEVFKNHKTIVIGVPGAFTKVCSAKHLPGYVNNNEDDKQTALDMKNIKENGKYLIVDDKLNKIRENFLKLI